MVAQSTPITVDEAHALRACVFGEYRTPQGSLRWFVLLLFCLHFSVGQTVRGVADVVHALCECAGRFNDAWLQQVSRHLVGAVL
jgi:hypothetical protein